LPGRVRRLPIDYTNNRKPSSSPQDNGYPTSRFVFNLFLKHGNNVILV